MKRIGKSLATLFAIFLIMNCFWSCKQTVTPPPEEETPPQEYTITYELNGGTNNTDNPASYTVESETITLKEPTRADYTFVGWYEKADFSGDAVTTITKGSTGNKTFYAKWNVLAYTITYVLSGGMNSTDNPASYTVESETITLKEPTKEGYTFAGWYETETFEGNPTTEISKGSTGNMTFYARWTKGLYKITYELNGGTNNSDNLIQYTIDDDAITLKKPTREGYSFAGWFESADFSGTAATGIAKGSTGNKTFYAKWKVLTYTITYVLNDDNSTDNYALYTTESETITLEVPTKDGYIFAGWYETETFEGNPTAEISKGSTGNKTFYEKWKVLTYTITYVLNNGTNSTDNPASYTAESGTITLKAPTRADYTFAGWFEKADFSGPAATGIAKGSTGNKTFYAKWKVLTYTIAYVLNDGTNNTENPASYTVESETITLKEPTRAGCVFIGWYETETFDGNSTAEITKGTTGDKTLYARWRLVVVTVSEVEKAITELKDLEDGTYAIKVTGKVTNSGISKIKTALTTLQTNNPNIFVDLDLSDTTGLTSIGGGAFRDCTNLASVTIGEGVTSIGNSAFYHCTNLASVTIGEGVTSIGNAAFYNCTSLASVTVKATTPPTLDPTAFDFNKSGRKFYVPATSVEEYKTADGWSGDADYIMAIE